MQHLKKKTCTVTVKTCICCSLIHRPLASMAARMEQLENQLLSRKWHHRKNTTPGEQCERDEEDTSWAHYHSLCTCVRALRWAFEDKEDTPQIKTKRMFLLKAFVELWARLLFFPVRVKDLSVRGAERFSFSSEWYFEGAVTHQTFRKLKDMSHSWLCIYRMRVDYIICVKWTLMVIITVDIRREQKVLHQSSSQFIHFSLCLFHFRHI